MGSYLLTQIGNLSVTVWP